MIGTQAGFFDSLIMTVRDNPVAAALVGGGALWLLIGEENLKSAARSATAAASPVFERGDRQPRPITAPPTAPEMIHEGSRGLGEMLRGVGAAASDAISTAGDQIRDRFDESVTFAREGLNKVGNPTLAKETLSTARSSLADIFERQPLVLGAVGLAIGAAVASAFHTSELENEWMGDLSDDVKADLNTRAEAVSESLGKTSDTLITELSDAGAEAVDLAKKTGMDAAKAASEEILSPDKSQQSG